MSNNQFGAGRLVPSSTLDFSRSAKNLAWLLECPLHEAQELLAKCYGFGSVHELKAAIPSPGDLSRGTGPFDEPRLRPPYFPVNTHHSYDKVVNELPPLSSRERQLLRLSMEGCCSHEDNAEDDAEDDAEDEGRFRRRHYAVLDGAFFSVPSVHRKKFAELKAGIVAMEGTVTARERFLEQNWPPAFWSYLEANHQQPMDATAGLAEIKDSSVYFNAEYVLSIANLFQETAAHRAPAIFLEMAGEDPEPLEDLLPDYDMDYFDGNALPSIAPSRTGLFEQDTYAWTDILSKYLSQLSDSQMDAICNLSPEVLAAAPPPGASAEFLVIARKWRLHHLRQMSKQYWEADYSTRYYAREAAVMLPSTTNNPSMFPRNHIRLYAEFKDRTATNIENENRQFLEFKVLLTYDAPGEPEDVVGYMAGWLACLASDEFVCDEEMLLDDVQYISTMLEDGLRGFLKGYCAVNGHDDLVSFVNSRDHHAVTITEIVLRDKYKKQGLMESAFAGFVDMHENVPFSDYSGNWQKGANFDSPLLWEELDTQITPPGVFMVPVHRKNKRLRQYLMQVSPIEPELSDDGGLDVFPFHVDVQHNGVDT